MVHARIPSDSGDGTVPVPPAGLRMTRVDGGLAVEILGSVTASNLPLIDDAIRAELERGAAAFLRLDLAGVSEFDSSTVGFLLRRASTPPGLRIAALSPGLESILQRAQLMDWLKARLQEPGA